MKSKILSVELIWDHFKRQIWVFAILSLLLVLAYPIATMIAFDNFNHSVYVAGYDGIYRQYLLFIKRDLALVGLMILTGGALLNGVAGFRFLHSGKMVDFYHSLPIRREKLFSNLAAAGIAAYAVPEIFSALLTLCIGAAQGYFSIELAGSMAVTVGLHLLFYLFIYGTTILAMLLTGRLLVGILGALAFLSYVPMAVFLFIFYGETFFTTFNSSGLEGSLLLDVGNYGSPLTWYEELRDRFIQGESMLLPLAAAAAATILVYVLCRFLYQKRPLEAAGQSMVFSVVAKAVKFLLVIPTALGVAMLAYHISPESSRKVWWSLGLILGILLAHGVLEVIYQADYKKFFSHRLELLIAAALTLAVASLFVFDLAGYDRYLPDQEEIAYISIDPNTLTDEQRMKLCFDKEGKPSAELGTDDWMQLSADDELYELTEEIKEARKRFDWGRMETGETSYQTLNFWFYLTNGRRVSRSYRVPRDGDYRQELDALWDREDFRLGMYSQLEDKKPYLDTVTFLGLEEVQLYRGNEKERFALLEAFQADLREASAETYQEACVGALQLEYQFSEDQQLRYLGTDTLYLYPGYTRTLEIVRKRGGVEKKIPAVEEVQKIKVYDYREDDPDGMGYLEAEKVYEEKEEIEEILPALSVRDLWSFQLPEMESNLSVEVDTVNEEGNLVTLYCGFRKGEVPELLNR